MIESGREKIIILIHFISADNEKQQFSHFSPVLCGHFIQVQVVSTFLNEIKPKCIEHISTHSVQHFVLIRDSDIHRFSIETNSNVTECDNVLTQKMNAHVNRFTARNLLIQCRNLLSLVRKCFIGNGHFFCYSFDLTIFHCRKTKKKYGRMRSIRSGLNDRRENHQRNNRELIIALKAVL